MTIKLGLVGVGKIARDQHLPVLRASPHFDLVATASRNATIDGVAAFADIDSMIEQAPEIEAVSLCQPPQVRFASAKRAIAAGKHVFLEKPPGATLGEVELLISLARAQGVSLFASWHSRYAAGVEPARAWLAERTIRSVRIEWKEDVRHWHPGQDWIWAPGGMGVFDPGINALSIATHILPDLVLTGATLDYPANRAAPIAAELAFETHHGHPVTASLDWLQTGPQSWDIHVETDRGALVLGHGGNSLAIDGAVQPLGPEAEYAGLYERFAALVPTGAIDVDLTPLRHVADALLLGERRTVAAFHD
jgi:D-galactose 1-dehydrogenase